VGSFAPNVFGLFDVIGNVREWCLDDGAHYTVPPRRGDGLRDARISGDPRSRINRGGSFKAPGTYGRSAERKNNPPDFKNHLTGVRAARPVN
jgi:formylglycine-generating enzyme required for sulfatase activity